MKPYAEHTHADDVRATADMTDISAFFDAVDRADIILARALAAIEAEGSEICPSARKAAKWSEALRNELLDFRNDNFGG